MASPNLKSLDFKTAGFWPNTFKLAAYAIAFVGILVLAWLAVLSGKRQELTSLSEKEATLRTEYDELQTKANNLPNLREELDQIKELLKTLVTRLPNKNEIPGLVVDVSQAAINNGLQVDLFEPLDEVKHDFYAEKRINVRLRGSYHQLGSLFSDIAKQPRLVAAVIDDMTLGVSQMEDGSLSGAPTSNSTAVARARQGTNATTELVNKDDTPLVFTGSVRTYRYLSEEEENEIAEAKKKLEAADKKKRRPAAKPAEEAAP